MNLVFRIVGMVLGLVGLFYVLGGSIGVGLIFILIGALIFVWILRAEKYAEKTEEREWRKQMLEAQRNGDDKVE